jgi:hypothetical protein
MTINIELNHSFRCDLLSSVDYPIDKHIRDIVHIDDLIKISNNITSATGNSIFRSIRDNLIREMREYENSSRNQHRRNYSFAI